MQNNSYIKNFLSELGLKNIENIEQDLGSGYVRLRISEAERRQALQDIKCVEDIIVELLRNSRDAESANIYIATKKAGDSERIIYFIDDALQLGISRVRILHGTGTGALRQIIRDYLGTVNGVAHFHDEHVQFGGAGITVVDLN